MSRERTQRKILAGLLVVLAAVVAAQVWRYVSSFPEPLTIEDYRVPLNHGAPALRAEAAVCIADRGMQEGVPDLEARLAVEQDPGVIQEIAWALTELGHGDAVVRGELAADDWERRHRALFLVESLNDPAGIAPRVIELVGSDPHPLVRATAARILAGIPGAAEPARPALEAAAADPDPEVRESAAAALRALGG